jgi:hypothetical protein
VDAVVGHEHEDQVVQDEVGTQVARLLGAAGQFGDGEVFGRVVLVPSV